VRLVVARWAAWAPGLEEPAAWARWSSAPAPLTGSSTPDARFLPPLVRRRCSAIVRVMLHVAHACTTAGDVGHVPTVFASRHGDCRGAVELMHDVARDTPITAAAFSHSVHNTAAGLHSIVQHNAQASTSTAGGTGTFASGVIEAAGLLDRSAARHVLLVVGDVPPPELFAARVREPEAPYGVALLLAREETGGDAVDLTFRATVAPDRPWPDAVEFLRWLLSPEPTAVIGRGRTATCWARDMGGARRTPQAPRAPAAD
jgi:hypothetical protein